MESTETQEYVSGNAQRREAEGEREQIPIGSAIIRVLSDAELPSPSTSANKPRNPNRHTKYQDIDDTYDASNDLLTESVQW
jgi:hypothetical protein